MGRQVKRVPLDFDWPMNVRWYGYFIGMPDEFDDIYEENAELYNKWDDILYML